jgi:hypothetical protein
MKLNFLIFLLSFTLLQGASAQTLPYQYNYWPGSYTTLLNATFLPASAWNEDVVVVNLGFTFQLNGVNYTTFELAPYEGSLFQNYGLDNGPLSQAILGYNTAAGLANKVGAALKYKTEGTAPNRIFKAEWQKVGFEGELGTVSFQIWLHETSNAVQFIMGPQDVPEPSSVFYNSISPIVGLVLNLELTPTDDALIGYGHFVQGAPSAPTDTVVVDWVLPPNDNGPQFGCTNLPLAQSVFTFTPGNVTSTKAPESIALSLYPNPASDRVFLQQALEEESNVQLLDIQGRTISQYRLQAGEQEILLPAGIAPGAYFLHVISGQKSAIGQIVIH